MYGKTGALKIPLPSFRTLHQRSVLWFNQVIRAYALQNEAQQVLQLFVQMQQEGALPNKFSFLFALSAFAGQASLAEGKRMHTRIVDSGFEQDVAVGTTLVKMYGNCGSLMDASTIFYRIPEKDTISWTSMIALYSEQRQGRQALQIFDQMLQEVVLPDKVTFVSVLAACASHASLVQGKRVHAWILQRRFESDVVISNALVNMYGRCGCVEHARRVFDKMRIRDVVSWTAIITAYCQHGQGKAALRLFDVMRQEGLVPDRVAFVSILDACASQAALAEGKQLHSIIQDLGFEADVVVGTALVNMYGKCGSLECSRSMFNNMQERNVVSWNAMIAVYADLGQVNAASRLLDRMGKEGVVPNKLTFISIIAVCGSQAVIIEGERAHATILDAGFALDTVMGNALVNMYGKCGRLEDALSTFSEMPERDVVSWNTVIALNAQHGQGEQALQLFQQMQEEGIPPDKVSFASLLIACSHVGLIHEGQHYFTSMSDNYGIPPGINHYMCMIDLLGRSGQLDEAEKLIFDMPFQPAAGSFRALLGACRYQVDIERAERAADFVLELDPENGAPYVMLANVYEALGKGDVAVNEINRAPEV